MPLNPRIRYLTRDSRLPDLLQKPQHTNLALPIANILRLDLNETHAGILSGAIVDAIAEVAEPCTHGFGVEVLDAGVVVGGGGDGAGDGDPVLSGRVLEGEMGGFVVVEVGEFVGMLVG